VSFNLSEDASHLSWMKKILHVTYRSALDPNEYSGISRGIHLALARKEIDVHNCCLQSLLSKFSIRFISGAFSDADPLRHPLTLLWFKTRVAAALRKAQYDLVLSSFYRHLSGVNAAQVRSVVWADTSFLQACDYYPDIAKQSGRFKSRSKAVERQLMRSVGTHVFSNDWAKRFHLSVEGLGHGSIDCIHYGPNLERSLEDADVRRLWGKKPKQAFRLLFSGVNFRRKGGDLLVDSCDILIARGLKLHVDAVGCSFPDTYLRPYITNHGFLDRRISRHDELYDSLWRQAHLCILPTRADCLPQVLLEACFYGIPAVATDTGGVGDAIIHGRSGKLVPPQAGSSVWADNVHSILSDNNLREYGIAAREIYNERFNWSDNVEKMLLAAGSPMT
jgi:glycosyltransferase involved in cell wall biosynthesis